MMDDPIFQEVDEDVQRKKIEEIWKRYGHYILGGALLIVLATALYNGWRSYKINAEQKSTGAVMAITNDAKLSPDQQIDKLTHFAKVNPGIAQSFIARLDAASIAMKKGKTDKAIGIYDNIAADTSVETAFRQLADMLSIQAQMDKGDPAILQPRLQKLVADSPWKATAKEMSAYLYLRSGDSEKAKQLFSELATDNSGVSASIAQRSKDMVKWLEEVKKPAGK